MSGIGTGYDLSSTTFSPDGRVFQTEYAGKAVENSGTIVAVRCKDGVVIAVEKIYQSRMMMKSSMRRVHIADRHIGLAVAGLLPDGRQIVSRARDEAAQYREVYGHSMPGHVVAEHLAGFVHLYTLYWHVRSFGCVTVLATYDDEHGPQLYMIETSGVFYRYYACATGKAKQQAKTELEKINLKEVSAREAVQELAKVLVNVHDESKDKLYDIEMIWVSDESKRRAERVPQELIDAARQHAELLKSQEDDDDDDDDDDDE